MKVNREAKKRIEVYGREVFERKLRYGFHLEDWGSLPYLRPMYRSFEAIPGGLVCVP